MAPGKGRTPFTEKDVTNLIKYLAIYSPTTKHRMGNKVYKDLENNSEGRWPWSQRHTWSSWRAHYKSNADRLDRKIREYQVEKNLLTFEKLAEPPQQPIAAPFSQPVGGEMARREEEEEEEEEEEDEEEVKEKEKEKKSWPPPRKRGHSKPPTSTAPATNPSGSPAQQKPAPRDPIQMNGDRSSVQTASLVIPPPPPPPPLLPPPPSPPPRAAATSSKNATPSTSALKLPEKLSTGDPQPSRALSPAPLPTRNQPFHVKPPEGSPSLSLAKGGRLSGVLNDIPNIDSGLTDIQPLNIGFSSEGARQAEADATGRPLIQEVHRKSFFTARTSGVPQIDLRNVSTSSRLRRQSSNSSHKTGSSTRGSTTATTTRRRSSLIAPLGAPRRRSSTALSMMSASPKDLQLLQDAGHKYLAKMAQRFGFDFGVALNVYEKLQDLDDTAKFLSKLRDESELVGCNLLKRMQAKGGRGSSLSRSESSESDGEGSGDGRDDRGLPAAGPSSKATVANREGATHNGRRNDHRPIHRHDHRRRSSGLDIRPIQIKDEDDASDYTPPRKSRAGRYARRRERERLESSSPSHAASSARCATPPEREKRLWHPVVMPYSQTPDVFLEELARAIPGVGRRKRRRSSGQDDDQNNNQNQNQIGGAEEEGPSLPRRPWWGRTTSPSPSPLVSRVEKAAVVLSPARPTLGVRDLVEARVSEDDENVFASEAVEPEPSHDPASDEDGKEREEEAEPEEEPEGLVKLSSGEDEDEESEQQQDDSEFEPKDIDESTTTLDPKDYFAALPPHQLEKQRELIKFATTVNKGNADEMREWEVKQDPELLKMHQAFLLETLRHRIQGGEREPLNFDAYFV